MRINYAIDDIRAFCCLARVGQYTAAADELCVTVSALSRRIAKLENQIGGRLFDRTTRQVSLTTMGRLLYGRVLPMLYQLDACLGEAARMAEGQEGQLPVSMVASVGYSIIPLVLPEFYARHPKVYVSIRDGNATMTTNLVEEREVEFGVTTPVSFGPALTAERVTQYAYNLVYCGDPPLDPDTPVSWRDLAALRVAGLNPLSSTRLQIDSVLNTHDIPLPWSIEVDQLATLIGLVQSRSFVTVMPALLKVDGYGLRSVPIGAPYIGRDVFIVRRRDSSLSPQGRFLLSLIRDALRTQGATPCDELQASARDTRRP